MSASTSIPVASAVIALGQLVMDERRRLIGEGAPEDEVRKVDMLDRALHSIGRLVSPRSAPGASAPGPAGDSAVAHLHALARLHPAQAPQLHAAADSIPHLRSACDREVAAVELARHLRAAGAEGLVITTAARLMRVCP